MSVYYRTALSRQESVSRHSGNLSDNEEGFSPKGSVDGDREPMFGGDKRNHSASKARVEDELNESLQKKSVPSSEEREGEVQNLEYSRDDTNIDNGMIGSPPGDKDTRNQTMVDFTGERDYEFAPKSENILHWHHFCSDFYSTNRSFKEVAEVAEAFGHKYVDLRPYMIEYPYVVMTTDKLPKCLELFRHMHLGALPVNDPNTGMPVAILTR